MQAVFIFKNSAERTFRSESAKAQRNPFCRKQVVLRLRFFPLPLFSLRGCAACVFPGIRAKAVLLQHCQDFCGVGIRLDLGHHFDDLTGFVDEKGRTDDAHAHFAVQLFLLPDAVRPDRL